MVCAGPPPVLQVEHQAKLAVHLLKVSAEFVPMAG